MTRHIIDTKVKNEWVTAAANVLEFKNTTSEAVCAGGETETVRLCLFAAFVPKICSADYMNQMTELHNKLAGKFPEMNSTRPEKKH